MNYQLFNYNFTLSAQYVLEREDLVKEIKSVSKHWCFQLENSDNNYLHYQGKMSLFKKRRPTEIPKIVSKLSCLIHAHFSPTSTEGEKSLYCLKEDTRTEGPWKDTDEPPPFIPIQIRGKTLRPYQQTIVDSAKEFNDRVIDVIYDPRGNIGKSFVKTYIGVHKIGRALPPMNDMKDMMAAVMDMPEATLYIIDMPKAMGKEKLYGFYSGIEEIKNGYAYDMRYKFREKYFNSPRIWVFTNKLPDESMLSQDRWRLWEVNRANWELEPVEPTG